MRFEEVVGFEGDPARVWIRASAIAEMPNYWCGTRSLLVTHESGGAKHAKVKFAFGGSGEAEISTDEGSRTLTIDYKSRPFIGRQIVTVNERDIIASWDVEFRGMYRIATRWNERHFRTGTLHALQRLAGGDRQWEEEPNPNSHTIAQIK